MSKSKMAKRTVEDIKNGLNLLATTDVSKYAAAVKNGLPYDYKEDIAVDALAYIEQLEKAVDVFAAKLPVWYSPEERLPPEDENAVLAIVTGNPDGYKHTLVNAYMMAYYYAECGWIIENYPEDMNLKVSFWTPLPEPPTEVNP